MIYRNSCQHRSWAMRSMINYFSLVFVTILFSGCGSLNERQSIEKVLKANKESQNEATSVASVVSQMRAIDFSGCPNDFKAAYIAHIHAWESLAEVEKADQSFQSNNDTGSVMLESFIRGFLGDPFGKSNEIRESQNQIERAALNAAQQIRSTFNRIEEIAVLHGANPLGDN